MSGMTVRQDTKDYFSVVLPTHIEEWPRELRQISVPSQGVHLTIDEAKRLGANQMDWWETWVPASQAMPNIDSIKVKLQRAFDHLKNPGFVRLGSRSAKDTMRWYQGGVRVMDVRAALDLLLDASERINDDLHLAVANDYRPWIWLREWMDIADSDEFRCFVHDCRLVGISQYMYDSDFPRVTMYAPEYKRVISTFIDQEVIPSLHLDNVVIDVVARLHDTWELTLLELNPMSRFTDPCLFDWQDPDGFDGSLRYRVADGTVRKA